MVNHILAFTRTPKKTRGVRLTSLEELLKHSHIVTIHSPLTSKTRGMVGERELKLMKSSAILINTAREEIVDRQAVFAALRENKIAGYGFETAEFIFDRSSDPLVQLPNVVATPHIAWHTQEALKRNVDIWVANIEALVKGRPKNVVNMQAEESNSKSR